MRQLMVTLKKQMIVCGLVLGLFTSTAYARTATGDVQAALDQLYPNQGWVAANVGDATTSVLSGLSGTSIRTHPTGSSSSSNSPATLTRKMLITGIDPELHLKVHCYSGGDWVLKVLVNGVQLGAGITVNSTTSVDYRFSLVAYVNTEVTLQLQNAAGGAKPWNWEVAYWDLIEIVDGVTATWTNAAGDGNPMNPENWACTNSAGAEVTSVIPTNMMVVRIPNGCTNSFPVGGAFLAREVVLPATIGANLDWSGITSPLSGTLDLQGWKLTLSELKGNATITDTSKTYELLEYIESTGTQYIDTGVIGKSPLTIAADVAIPQSITANSIFIGSRKTKGGSDRFYPIGFVGGKFWSQYIDGNLNYVDSAYVGGRKYHVVATANSNSQKLDVVDSENGSTTGRTLNKALVDTQRSMYLFDSNIAGNKGGFPSSLKLYGMTISDGNGIVRNFLPVRQVSTGKVGLLDLANRGENEFYANEAKTGDDFTAGAITNYIYAAGVATTPAELHVEVAAGETRTNETVTLSGSLKLVKKGEGTFVAAKSGQTYLDGTVVEAGTFRVAAADEKTSSFVGPSGRAITVNAGATLDVNGNPGFDMHPLVLAGGTLKNGATGTSVSVGGVTLTDDSDIVVGGGLTHTADVDLGGKALTVDGLSGETYYTLAAGASFTNGSVYVVQGGWSKFDGSTARDMSTVDLKIGNAVNIAANVTVRNLESAYAGLSEAGDGKFLVTGTYKPTTAFHRDCEMQNGSVLDLSALAVPLSNVTFAAGATVTVKLGERVVAVGDRVVSWELANKPGNTVTFKTDRTDAAYADRDLDVRDDGLYLVSRMVARATWTGNGDPQNVNDPGNWDCQDSDGGTISGFPSAGTIVTLPDGCTNSFPVGEAFQARGVVLPATIGANLDWSGITAPLSGTLDLQGRRLTLLQLTGDATITDNANVKYERLDWIESDQNHQYIDTGVIGMGPLTITTDITFVQGTGNSIFIGSRKTTGGGDRFYPIGVNQGQCKFFIQYASDNSAVYAASPYVEGRKYHVVATANSTSQKLEIVDLETGGRVELTSSRTLVNTARNMYLFDANVAGASGKFPCCARLYGLTISNGTTILRNFVPVRQISTGKVGLLDLANRGANEFYTNNGTVSFTAGAVTGYICNDTAPGELHVCVASGSVTNGTVAFAGGLKLVKDGAGTFVAAKPGQTYAGGTEVAAGTFQVGTDDESVNRFAGTERSSVTVDAGATLDVNGNIGFEKHPLVLAGGTVKSSGTSNYLVESAKLGDVTLTANSTINPNQHIRCSGLFDLGAHTLTLTPGSGKYFEMMAGSAFTNGVVDATGSGYISFAGAAARDMGTVDLRINCGTRVGDTDKTTEDGDITVRDLALGWTVGTTSYAYGDGSILINGTFTPRFATGYHRNCVMQNGSTLNLAEQAGAWPLEPGDPPSGKDQACTPLAFAEGATINVTLGDRRPKSGPIVTWQEGNDPGKDVTFVLDPSVNARLVRKPEGLWLQTGFMIRIR